MADKTNKIGVQVTGKANLGDVIKGLEDASRAAAGLDDALKDTNKELGTMGRLGKLASEAIGKDGKGSWGDFFGKQGSERMRQLFGLVGGGMGAGAMYGRVSGGADRYKQHLIALDDEARAVKRLGQAYAEYRKQVIDAGRAYGFSNDEVIGLQSALARTSGRAGADRLLGNMGTIQGVARTYGMGALEAGQYFTQAERAGMIGPGGDVSDMRQFASMIADSVAVGNMGGREDEVFSSLNQLVGAINARTVDIRGTNMAASALATMNATGVRGLQGQAGASLLGSLNNAIMNPGGGEAGQLFMYNALTGGKGGMRYADVAYLQEEGLGGVNQDTGKTNMQSVMEAVNKMPVSGRYRLMAASQLTGMSMHQYEALENTFMKDGVFQSAKIGALQEKLGPQGLQSVDTSTWGMLAELANGGDTSAVAKEFEQLSGQKVNSTDRDALFSQIQQYGTGNVAMSEGQQRDKLDQDINKASEDVGSHLYGLQTAADQATLALLKMSDAIPGPAGGLAPIVGGGIVGNVIGNMIPGLLGKGMGKFLPNVGKMIPGLGGAGAATTTAAEGAATTTATTGVGTALAPVATFGAGVLAGVGSAAAADQFAQRQLGTVAFGGEEHQSALDSASNFLASDKISLWEKYKQTTMAGLQMIVLPTAVVGGAFAAGGAALTGGDAKQSYFDTFDFMMGGGTNAGKPARQPAGGVGGGGSGWSDADMMQRTDAHGQPGANGANGADGRVRVQIDPITIQMPNGQNVVVQPQAQYVPFDGVQSSPTVVR